MSKPVVFVTCNEQPKIQPSDALVRDALRVSGIEVIDAPWNGPFDSFEKAGLILLRSTWDYQADIKAFRDWLARASSAANVFNAPALVNWNASKEYLFELASKGAPLPPTKPVKPDAASIRTAMDALGLVEAVVKPLVGATASGLSIVRRDDPGSITRAAAHLGMDGLIQPLLPAIRSHGETSLIFFNGRFTHAVVKRPRQGDIRCQSDHGGTVETVDVPGWARERARQILALAPSLPLYARVDVIIEGETLWLMELELIEPELFFPYCPEAATVFADAIINHAEQHETQS